MVPFIANLIIKYCKILSLLHVILTNEMHTYKSHSGINPFTLMFIKITNLVKMYFLWCQLFHLALHKVSLHKYDSLFRFILLLCGDMQQNPQLSKSMETLFLSRSFSSKIVITHNNLSKASLGENSNASSDFLIETFLVPPLSSR